MKRFLIILIITCICLFIIKITNAQYNKIPEAKYIDKDHSITFLNEDDKLYVLIINPNTQQGTGYNIFEPINDSFPDFKYQSQSPTLILKKKDLICPNNLEIKQYNDLLDIDKSLLIKQFKSDTIQSYEHLQSFFGYYSLREKNIYQVGTTCFIGSLDELKAGNYSVLGINYCNDEVLYYLAFFEKRMLKKVLLSNGLTIGNFINKYETFSIAVSDIYDRDYIYETLINGQLNSASISSKRDDFYIKYDHGGHDLSYLFPPNKQTNFKIKEKPDKIFEYIDQVGNTRYYSTYGRSIASIPLLGDPGEVPKTYNFAKYNDPNGVSVTIGLYKPRVDIQEHVEYDAYKNFQINIAQFDKINGITLSFPSLIKRYVAIAQITESGWVNKHIHISDNFNHLMGNTPPIPDGFLVNKLHQAIWYEKEDSIPILLKDTTLVYLINIDKQTALHIAAYKNNHYIIRQLVDAGAEIYFSDNYGNTPLHIAAAFGDNKTVDFLIKSGIKEKDTLGIKGVDISNINMETPLFLAVLNNNLATVKKLIKNGAYVNSWNIYGQTPLSIATYRLNNSINNIEKTEALKITESIANASKWFSPNKIQVSTIAGNDSLKNVSVSNLKFYESSDQTVPYDQRKYQTVFASTNVRYIGYEVTLNYDISNSKKEFTIKAIWHKSNGDEINTDIVDTYADINWNSSFHTRLYGNIRYGAAWKPGLYYVDFYLNDQKMANAHFVIY